jgi:hypothetical protein
MIYTDKELSHGLCIKDKKISNTFYKYYEDYLYKIAGINLHKASQDEPTIQTRRKTEGSFSLSDSLFELHDPTTIDRTARNKKFEKFIHTTKAGAPLIKGGPYSIRMTDNVMLAYIWLLERIINEACKYSEIDNPHSTFERVFHLKTCTNNFKWDWVRKMKGSTQYIPKYIREKGPIYEQVVRLKLQGKTKEEIRTKLGKTEIIDNFATLKRMDALLYREIIEDEGVKRYLLKRDKLFDNAQKKSATYYESIDNSLTKINSEGDELTEDIADETYSPEKNLIINNDSTTEEKIYQLKNECSKIIKSLFTDQEIAILKVFYEDNDVNRDRMLSFIKGGNLMRAKRLNIETPSKFYAFEKKSEIRFIMKFVEKYPKVSEEIARQYFHEYFINFYSS